MHTTHNLFPETEPATTAAVDAASLSAQLAGAPEAPAVPPGFVLVLLARLKNARTLVDRGFWTEGAKILDELIAAAPALAAAPQAPAATPACPAWHSIDDGIPHWTDDHAVRVIAITAHDEFGGVQVHDIRASDFHDAEGEGTDVTHACTHWAYRDDIWPHADAVPAAPAQLVWLSPNCKHFSKAKGGTPLIPADGTESGTN